MKGTNNKDFSLKACKKLHKLVIERWHLVENKSFVVELCMIFLIWRLNFPHM